jgi:hypothetical protein
MSFRLLQTSLLWSTTVSSLWSYKYSLFFLLFFSDILIYLIHFSFTLSLSLSLFSRSCKLYTYSPINNTCFVKLSRTIYFFYILYIILIIFLSLFGCVGERERLSCNRVLWKACMTLNDLKMETEWVEEHSVLRCNFFSIVTRCFHQKKKMSSVLYCWFPQQTMAS